MPVEDKYKAMYIQLSWAWLDYNLNIRHCLYKVDADQIMLQLPSHDPTFLLVEGGQVQIIVKEQPEFQVCVVLL